MRPLALAEREVDALGEIETMCGRPVAGFMCVKRGADEAAAGSGGGGEVEKDRSCCELLPSEVRQRSGQLEACVVRAGRS